MMARRPRRNDQNDSVRPNSSPKPWEEGEGGGGSFGSWLRQQREIRNISLREISDSTKIGMRYLEALEDDRFDVLPAPIFAKGFLREYARYVGLDADEVVNFYMAADREGSPEDQPPVPSLMVPTGPANRRRSGPWWGVAVALLAIVLLTWYLVHRAQQQGAVRSTVPPITPPVSATPIEPAPAVAPETASAPAAAAPQGAPKLVVSLSFTDECWVEAVVDDQQRISELRVQGESMQIAAQQQVSLTLGNAAAVRIEVNGRPYPLDAAPGRVVHDLAITRADAGLPPLPAGGVDSGKGTGTP